MGQPASTDPAQLRHPTATSQIPAPSQGASVKLQDGEPTAAGVAASPGQNGFNTHPSPWKILTSPEGWGGHLLAVTLLSASCSPVLKPKIRHSLPSYNGALLPCPAWKRLLTRAGLWVALPGTCLLLKDRVRSACKGRGSHLNVREERTVVSYTNIH